MTVRIVCVGKLKERYFEDACAEFQKRLDSFIRKCRANKMIGFGGVDKYYR